MGIITAASADLTALYETQPGARGPAQTPAQMPDLFIIEEQRRAMLRDCLKVIATITGSETLLENMGLGLAYQPLFIALRDDIQGWRAFSDPVNAARIVDKLEPLKELITTRSHEDGTLTQYAFGGVTNSPQFRKRRPDIIPTDTTSKFQPLSQPKPQNQSGLPRYSTARTLYYALRMTMRVLEYEFGMAGFETEARRTGKMVDMMVDKERQRVAVTKDRDGDNKKPFSPARQRFVEKNCIRTFLEHVEESRVKSATIPVAGVHAPGQSFAHFNARLGRFNIGAQR